MNFKEMYLNGMCPFGYIDSCADQWRSRPDIGVSAEDFLGLTHEEYQMYLQALPGASLKECLDAQRRTQKFRVYQLDFKGVETYPFAYRGIEDMREAGYEQPPAERYQLVYDGELTYPKTWSETDVLRRIYELYNDDLPEDFHGHSLSKSDIVELYDGDNRDFFYSDDSRFTPVRFDAERAKPMDEADGDG